MQESVTEIVKNLKQGPLLVHIYSDNEFEKVKIKTEKACLGEWPVVKKEWENGELKSPDGLIFVEELDSENLNYQDCEESMARAWGVVVQGKGMECGPICYLLKTNRVCGGLGLGFCTHFCLMRVKNFRHSALEQFNDSWLLQ
ncbi:hypothetical protein ACJIZ3_009491 [Penstemon smallii]|uniref:DUF7804 domain-containing protein n=1 Tax=Penstemon smallii TaxID=265156 RepID=A0ABD3TCN8_9LAMI